MICTIYATDNFCGCRFLFIMVVFRQSPKLSAIAWRILNKIPPYKQHTPRARRGLEVIYFKLDYKRICMKLFFSVFFDCVLHTPTRNFGNSATANYWASSTRLTAVESKFTTKFAKKSKSLFVHSGQTMNSKAKWCVLE